jgi:dienelactone hydrolase
MLNRFTGPAVASLFILAGSALAEVPRALPDGKLPEDSRLGSTRNLDDYFPFTPVDTKEAWARRREQVRQQLLVGLGLWPLPTRTPLNAVVHTKIERDDYTVEHVMFESFPGHYVTGNLYRPKGRSGKLPVVLNPHGHWPDGRFNDQGEANTRKEIAEGGERFEVGGRYPLQARCVQLARMGCVVFHYDMLGYADSIQFPAHRPGVRPAMNTAENWGLFSPQAELHEENIMGVQTWNSIRAVDFVTELPDVDPARIAVTGASGGGTQTFILCAIDDRPALCHPAVMVSTAMQGGCSCENAPYLRIDQGNIDIAGLMAPKPMSMTFANDWTKETATKGLPDLQKLYEMLGAKDNVMGKALPQFGHNYNSVSRTVMYNWVNRHFKLGVADPVIERDYQPLSRRELTVWDADHPKPTGDKVGEAHERTLAKWWADDAAQQIAALAPTDDKSLKAYRRVVAGGWESMIGAKNLPQNIDPATLKHEVKVKKEVGDVLLMFGLLTHAVDNVQLPTLFMQPKEKWNGQVVLWVTDTGKNALLTADAAPIPPVASLLKAGFAVAGLDTMLQGEFLAPGQTADKQPVGHYGDGKEPWMQAAAYRFGYNRPLFCQRVADVLTMIRFIETDKHTPQKLHLVGLGPVAGPIAAAARALDGGRIDRAAIDTAGFRFAKLTEFTDPMFTPGSVKYCDTPGLLSLNAPGMLWLAGEGAAAPPLVAAAYKAAGKSDLLTIGTGDKAADAVAAWLAK